MYKNTAMNSYGVVEAKRHAFFPVTYWTENWFGCDVRQIAHMYCICVCDRGWSFNGGMYEPLPETDMGSICVRSSVCFYTVRMNRICPQIRYRKANASVDGQFRDASCSYIEHHVVHGNGSIQFSCGLKAKRDRSHPSVPAAVTTPCKDLTQIRQYKE